MLEAPSGQVVGIEIKASKAADGDAFKDLRGLAEQAGQRLLRGLVLYEGREAVPFGKELQALPLNAMWRL